MALKNKSSLTVLTASAVAILTAGTNEVYTLSKVLVTNTDSVARTVTVYHDVTGAAGAVTGTLVIKALSLSAGETKTLPLSSVFLANGAKLYALADVTSVVNLDINYTTSEQTA